MKFPDINVLRRKLPLPPLLVEMLATGRWQHPGDDVMPAKVPFIRDPLDFLATIDQMIFESGPMMSPDAAEDEFVKEYRGSVLGERQLPWIDVEKSLTICVCRYPGDDVHIALDYRLDLHHPRVIGSDFWHGPNLYREISPTFEDFVALLGL